MDDFLIVARWLHYAAAMSLFGVFAFLCVVAGPGACPVLRRRLLVIAWVSLVLGLASGAMWLFVVSAQISGQPLAAVLDQGILGTVLIRTRFGEVWTWRFAFAVILAALLAVPSRRRGGWWNGCGLGLAAGVLAALAWAGHGGATPGPPGVLHLAADVLHLLAAGAWVGSLAPLALLLTEPLQSAPTDLAPVRRAVARFSILAAASVAILIAAGLVNTWFLAGTAPALIGTEYGRWLVAKIAIFLTMVTIATVNLLRMAPRLTPAAGKGRSLLQRALRHLRRNAMIEAGLGLAVLFIVAILGVLPPGLHTEPGWPLSFRLKLSALSPPAFAALAATEVVAGMLALTFVATAAAGRHRATVAAGAGLLISVGLCALILLPVIEPAYPTSFFAPAQPYAASSIARGSHLYAANCALCHGADGTGDGPAAAALAVRPADLTKPHLFAHSEGDLFWWVSHGKAKGAMPGFAEVMSAAERWDVINFVRARAAGILSRRLGPEIASTALAAVPDFAFQADGRQQTLTQLLRPGPALIVLLDGPAPASRLAQLAAAQTRFAATGLQVVAVELGANAMPPPEAPPSYALVTISSDVAATLGLFRSLGDGAETDLLVDRAGTVRARWTATGEGGLPGPDTLASDAERIAQSPAAPPTHAGHHD